MSFTPLKDLLPKAANKFQLAGEMKAAWVLNRASALIKKIFPEEAASEIRAKRFHDGVLWLTVTNSVVAQEVQMKSLDLRDKLNADLGESLVKSLRSIQEARSAVE